MAKSLPLARGKRLSKHGESRDEGVETVAFRASFPCPLTFRAECPLGAPSRAKAATRYAGHSSAYRGSRCRPSKPARQNANPGLRAAAARRRKGAPPGMAAAENYQPSECGQVFAVLEFRSSLGFPVGLSVGDVAGASKAPIVCRQLVDHRDPRSSKSWRLGSRARGPPGEILAHRLERAVIPVPVLSLILGMMRSGSADCRRDVRIFARRRSSRDSPSVRDRSSRQRVSTGSQLEF